MTETNVVDLFKPKPEGPDGPHLEGAAFCGRCDHRWTAVAPVGETHLECPRCRRMWGAFKNVVEPATAWRCRCGEQLFWLTPNGAMCRGCGAITVDWAE